MSTIERAQEQVADWKDKTSQVLDLLTDQWQSVTSISATVSLRAADVLAMFSLFASRKDAEIRLDIFHCKGEESTDNRPFGTGYPGIPYLCPACRSMILNAQALRYEFSARRLRKLVELTIPGPEMIVVKVAGPSFPRLFAGLSILFSVAPDLKISFESFRSRRYEPEDRVTASGSFNLLPGSDMQTLIDLGWAWEGACWSFTYRVTP